MYFQPLELDDTHLNRIHSPWSQLFLRRIGTSYSTPPIRRLCDFFIPIITSTYLKRIGYEGGTKQESWEAGFVHDEFQQVLLLSRKKHLGFLTILREGSVKMLERAQLGWNGKNVIDMTDLPLIEDGEAQVVEVDPRTMKISIKGTVAEKRSVEPNEKDKACYERMVFQIGEVFRTSRGNRKPAMDMELDAFLYQVLFDLGALGSTPDGS